MDSRYNRRGRNVKGRAIPSPDAWLGVGLLLLPVGVAIEGANVTIGFGYDTVGPRAFPYLIAAGLLVSGVSILVVAFRHAAPAETAQSRDWIAVIAISITLIMQMA